MDRREAMRIAQQLEDAERTGIITANAVRRNITEAYERYAGEKLPADNTRAFFARWVIEKTGEVTQRTAEKYKKVGESFIDHLGSRADQPLLLVRKSDVSLWHQALARGKSGSTANNYLKILRVAFADAEREEVLDSNPASLVKVIKVQSSSTRRPFTLDEVKALVEHSSGEMRTLILLGYYTGQRLGDLCRLEWSSVRLNTLEIVLTTGKTGRKQEIPLQAGFAEHLKGLRPKAWRKGCVMPRLAKKYCDSGASSVSKEFRRVLVETGLAEDRKHKGKGIGRSSKRRTEGLSFHCFRHTLTSTLKSAGVSGQIAQEIVGHDSAAISSGYSHIDSDAIRSAVSKIPEVLT